MSESHLRLCLCVVHTNTKIENTKSKSSKMESKKLSKKSTFKRPLKVTTRNKQTSHTTCEKKESLIITKRLAKSISTTKCQETTTKAFGSNSEQQHIEAASQDCCFPKTRRTTTTNPLPLVAPKMVAPRIKALNLIGTTRALVILLSGCCCVALAVTPPARTKSIQRTIRETLPDSVYKNAPLLFGADIIDDYYTEPAAGRPVSTPSTTSTTSKRPPQLQAAPKRASSGSVARASSNQTSMTNKGARLKRVVAPNESSAAQEAAAGAIRDMAKSGGVSMDHVISSLGLVVEAMKQQTMAMQMMSGQMAAASAVPAATSLPITSLPATIKVARQVDSSLQVPPVQPGDIRALLESFGEMIGSLKGVKGTPIEFGAQQEKSSSSPAKQVGALSVGVSESVKGGAKEAQIIIQDEPVQVITERTHVQVQVQVPMKEIAFSSTAAPTSSSSTTTTTTTTARPTTTTTTTTTTPTPTPSTTSAPSTTATPKVPNGTVTGSTEAPQQGLQKPTPELITVSPYTSGKEWRQVVPFDFYPPASSHYSDEMTLPQGNRVPESGPIVVMQPPGSSGGEAMTSFGSSASQMKKHLSMGFSPMTGNGDNYRSVGMPAYGASAPLHTTSQVHQAYPQQQSAMMFMMMNPQHQHQQQPAPVSVPVVMPLQLQMQMQPQYHSINKMPAYLSTENQQQQQQQQHKMMMLLMRPSGSGGSSSSSSNNNNLLLGDSEHTGTFGLNQEEHVMTSTRAPVIQAQQHLGQSNKMANAMAAFADQMQLLQEQRQQMQVQVQQQQQQQQPQQLEDVSDEIPRVPSSADSQLIMSGGGRKTSASSVQAQGAETKTLSALQGAAGIKGAIKIGERPQFDPANFQMLDTAVANQQRKQTMQMLQQVLEAAKEQQKVQQQQQLTGKKKQQQEQLPAGNEEQASGADLNEIASSQSNSLLKNANSDKDQVESAGSRKGQQQQVMLKAGQQQQVGSTSFSILGGRFKITPHTQMLHYLLEPSKVLLQQAFGQFRQPTSMIPQTMLGVGSQSVPQVPRRKVTKSGSSNKAASGGKMSRTAKSKKNSKVSSSGKKVQKEQ